MALTQEQKKQLGELTIRNYFSKICEVCEANFISSSNKAKYCSPACSCIAYRARLAEKRIAQADLELERITKESLRAIKEKQTLELEKRHDEVILLQGGSEERQESEKPNPALQHEVIKSKTPLMDIIRLRRPLFK